MAATLARRKKLKAIVYKGTKEEAVWRCLGANALHGLRRSNVDKAWAIERAIKMRPDRSNRFIADHVGVDHNTVSRLRWQLQSTGEIHQLTKLRGRDGRWRPAKLPNRFAPVPTGEIHQSDEERRRRWKGTFDGMDHVALLKDVAKEKGVAAASIWPRRPDGKFAKLVGGAPGSDGHGHLIDQPEKRHVREAFDRRRDVACLLRRVELLHEDLMLAFGNRDALVGHVDWRELDYHLRKVLDRLRALLPHAVCPKCDGAGCEECCQRGWLERDKYDEARGLKMKPEPVEICCVNEWGDDGQFMFVGRGRGNGEYRITNKE